MFLIHESEALPYELEGRTSSLLIGPASGSLALTHNVSFFHPGHAPGHVHDPEEEVFYVDEGAGEVWIDGVPYALEPGTLVHTPQRVEHNVHVAGDQPMRIVGNFSPHVIPGSYANLPARSRDLPDRPANVAPFVIWSGPDGHLLPQPVVATERLSISILHVARESALDASARGGDLIEHVLSGSGLVRTGDAVYRIRRGSVLLLTGSDHAVIEAEEDLRMLESRAWEARGEE